MIVSVRVQREILSVHSFNLT
uniref:Uncharacterized protein n=1 Tax=Rhizophora mucronata TaxID=61149 RepID=A0A2P2ND47_RHIMU